MLDEPSIREAHLLVGPLFSEPMQVETVRQGAPGTWIVSLAGSLTQQFRRVTLTRTIFGFSELSIRSVGEGLRPAEFHEKHCRGQHDESL
jgi:hypothetical protein